MVLKKQNPKEQLPTEKVTVLTRPVSHKWEYREVTKLVCNLKVALERHPNHPALIVIRGEYDRKRIQEALGKSDFEHRIVAVSESKKSLPFEILPR